MGFFGYLVLGAIMYVLGFGLHQKVLSKQRTNNEQFPLTHPLMIKYNGICFVVMLAVSALIGHFLLKHDAFDWAFIVVNSAVATAVFYFGINPDTTKMNLPH